MSVPRSTLAMRLERHRLEHRLLRIAGVVSALRGRAEEHEREVGRVPNQLLGIIADFEEEIGAMHERLRALGVPSVRTGEAEDLGLGALSRAGTPGLRNSS